jgi:hypothetical protein
MCKKLLHLLVKLACAVVPRGSSSWSTLPTGQKVGDDNRNCISIKKDSFFYFIKSSACFITVSNTICCCNHTILLLVFICIYLLVWFNFSRSIDFTYLVNCFKYLLVSSLLLTGQLHTISTLVFSFSLSFFSPLHWNIRWSTVCVPCLRGHSGQFNVICVRKDSTSEVSWLDIYTIKYN